MVKIDLQHNELSVIPHCLLELPSLGELNLSHNRLTEIPDIPEWSACLTMLELSHNQLSSLPLKVVAPTIRSLNLSHNNFRTVPLCICSFITLHSLNLSDNPDILTLPAEMGRLNMLDHLNLNNLKDLKDPPRNVQKDPRDCIHYLNSKLHSVREFYRMKLMVVGQANKGKTALVKRLQGKECGNEATVGVEVSEWWFKPSIRKKPFHFSIWDFSGLSEYYATHQCFLSQHSLYLLVFNLTDGEAGVEELKPWLNNLALRAPQSCVLIVGTHLDEVPAEEREEIDALLHKVGRLAESYNNKLQIVEVMPVGLKNRIENIGLLKEALYNHAASYKTRAGQVIMGQKIPASYHALDKQLEVVQQEVRQGLREPIMHAEEFKTMVQQMSLADIQDEEELKKVVCFLTDVGSLLHYDDRSHNLHELYFIDPCWLCNMMSKIVTIKERNPFIKKGILHSKYIPLLFKDDVFPLRYFEQYLSLLDRFEIALPLNNKYILIPSMLPDERLAQLTQEDTPPMYSRYILFNSAVTPPGFWSRLLSRIMHSIPQVCFALNKSLPSFLAEEYPSKEEKGTDFSLNMPGTPLSPDPSFATNSELGASSLSHPLPVISKPMRQVSQDQYHLDGVPQLCPGSLPSRGIYDAKDIQLEYWHSGLYYSDPDITFRIESFIKSPQQAKHERKDGVLIVVSPNNKGKRIIGQLVDLVISLSSELYPGLAESHHGANSMEQRIPCSECIKMERSKPFEFQSEQCLQAIAQNLSSIDCEYHCDNPAENHTVSLADIVPDLLLQDMDPVFLLNAEDIDYQEDEASLLGKGGYGKVYRGKYQGRAVAIKKYLTCNEKVFASIRSEALSLQKSYHPCFVCLVGVCVHPKWALVLEDAPLQPLELLLLKKKLPVHRLTIFRIAAEVASALCFLHGQEIIFRDLTAANVLLWTLDPASLCHCKLTDFGIATHMAPMGARGFCDHKWFIAPEVPYIDKRGHSPCDYKADIFSFGMFLYQMIARRHPYHNIPLHKIDASVKTGERPILQDVCIAKTGFNYLTMLMKKCWEDNPQNRPTTHEIIKTVCLASVQSIMCVSPVQSKLSLCKAIALTPASFAEAGNPAKWHNELWVCCNVKEGTELNIFNSHTMEKMSKNFIKDNQVQCMVLCNNHVWVGSRAGIEYGVIDIFDITSHELVHNIRLRETSASCLTAAKDRVLMGTLEGYCFSFSNDVTKVRTGNPKPKYKYISEHAVDGIACTKDFIWVSHGRHIHFLNHDSLALEGTVSRDEPQDAFIGQLSASPSENIIWSAHLGGTILTAWDSTNRTHSLDVDTSKRLPEHVREDAIITAMLPALDTVWVGMATGHIMVFHHEELLALYHPYKAEVRFLTLIPGSGPCEMEKCMVVSGGKKFVPVLNDMGLDYEEKDEKGQPLDGTGVLVTWEAYEAKTMRQIKLVEENAPGFLDTHASVCHMINIGEFKDGTEVMQSVKRKDTIPSPYLPNLSTEAEDQTQDKALMSDDIKNVLDLEAQENLDDKSMATDNIKKENTPSPPDLKAQTSLDHLSTDAAEDNKMGVPEVDNIRIHSPLSLSDGQKHPEMEEEEKLAAGNLLFRGEEVFEITLPGSTQTVCVACPKPPTLKNLLNEVQLKASLSKFEYHLQYVKATGEVAEIESQKHLDSYLALPNTPKLYIRANETGMEMRVL